MNSATEVKEVAVVFPVRVEWLSQGVTSQWFTFYYPLTYSYESIKSEIAEVKPLAYSEVENIIWFYQKAGATVPIFNLSGFTTFLADYKKDHSLIIDVKMNVIADVQEKELNSVPNIQQQVKEIDTKLECDHCKTVLEDFGYLCMPCKYYQLCKKCGGEGVHGDHLMLRVSMTNFQDISHVIRVRRDKANHLTAKMESMSAEDPMQFESSFAASIADDFKCNLPRNIMEMTADDQCVDNLSPIWLGFAYDMRLFAKKMDSFSKELQKVTLDCSKSCEKIANRNGDTKVCHLSDDEEDSLTATLDRNCLGSTETAYVNDGNISDDSDNNGNGAKGGDAQIGISDEMKAYIKRFGLDEGWTLCRETGASPFHTDPKINSAIETMMEMGFTNEGGWLGFLLANCKGNISKALEIVQPTK